MSERNFVELKGFRVVVEKVVFVSHLDAPEEKPFPFVYFITIINESDQELTVTGRKWVITEEGGEITVVEGEGVVGERPRLKTGQRFSYNSYHVISRSGSATGSFFGNTKNGIFVRATIPIFRMRAPF